MVMDYVYGALKDATRLASVGLMEEDVVMKSSASADKRMKQT